ncbi:MAG: alanine racemase [Firmicutes bacterium]|nr:alanine racemase [Bacillota bacterium]
MGKKSNDNIICVKISAKTILENIRTLKKNLEPNVQICAVIKANAYSLGDVEIAKILLPYVSCFAVAHLAEAKRLRDANITNQILLLGPCQDFKKALDLDLMISINSVSEAKNCVKVINEIQKQKLEPLNVHWHIKVNTGLNRFGISELNDLQSILNVAIKCSSIKLGALYTHLSYDEQNTNAVNEQLERFVPFKTLFKQYAQNGIIHAACSHTAHYNPAQFDMVRIGKSFYGGYHGYKTALDVKAKITATQNIKSGERVGYNGTFQATENMKIGVVACGYADIMDCNFANKTYVYVDDVKCKIIGRICMDAFMIDVTQIKNPMNKMATIIANRPGITIMELCEKSDIIACDLFCGLNFGRAKLTYTNR